MRVCPKCGYIDPPEWKHIPFSYYLDGCAFEEFKLIKPNLASQIINGLVDDDIYVYRLSKNKRWVQRKAKIDYDAEFGRARFEKTPSTNGGMNKLRKRSKFDGQKRDIMISWFKLHPNQRRLLEICKK